MKIKVDDQDLFELSETQKKVICNDIPSDILEEDMCRRLRYILMHKYERCFERLKSEWMPKLQSRMKSVPTDPDELAKIIFSQPDYQDRKKRDKDSSLTI